MRTHRTGALKAPLLRDKLKTVSELRLIRRRLRKRGISVVFTNGCFDILHYGHVKYLEAARRAGDCLIVAVNSDASVRRIKGDRRPIVPETDRAGVIAALASVDYVVVFREATPQKVIEALVPDVLVKGGDWSRETIVGAGVVERAGGRVLTIPLERGRSTTGIIGRVLSAHCSSGSGKRPGR